MTFLPDVFLRDGCCGRLTTGYHMTVLPDVVWKDGGVGGWLKDGPSPLMVLRDGWCARLTTGSPPL